MRSAVVKILSAPARPSVAALIIVLAAGAFAPEAYALPGVDRAPAAQAEQGLQKAGWGWGSGYGGWGQGYGGGYGGWGRGYGGGYGGWGQGYGSGYGWGPGWRRRGWGNGYGWGGGWRGGYW